MRRIMQNMWFMQKLPVDQPPQRHRLCIRWRPSHKIQIKRQWKTKNVSTSYASPIHEADTAADEKYIR